MPQHGLSSSWSSGQLPHLHAQTHCLIKYFVHHKYDISNDYNTFNQHPWHGAGQGTANAALCYIILLDTLIDAYHEKIQQ